MRVFPWLLCLIGLLISPVVIADDSNDWKVSWEKDDSSAWLGLPHILTVISVNGPQDINLEIEPSRDWKIEEQRVQSVNGGKPVTAFRLNCIALIAGDVPLPKMEVTSHQGRLNVPAHTLTVKSPEIHQGSSIELSFSKTEVYEREALKLKAKWTTTLPLEAIKALKWVIPVLEHPDFRVIEVRQLKEPDESKSIGLPIGQRRLIGTWTTSKLKDIEARSLSFEILVQPKKAGTYNLRPSFLVNSVERDLSKYKNRKWRGNRYPSYFNNNFFEATQDKEGMKRTICLSKPQTLIVKALPTPPKHLKGEVEVGFPNLKISAEPKRLKVGDPLHLEIVVEHAMPEVFELPLLSSLEAFDRNFRTPDDRSPAIYEKNGTKVYRQTLWPKRSNLSMVPPLVLHCFDPESGFYRESVSNSVEIEVLGGEGTALEMAEFAGNIVIKSSVEADPEGIWHHVWSLDHHPEFVNTSPHVWRSLLIIISILVLAAQFGPTLWNNFCIWHYDSSSQKVKRFLRDLQQWRAKSLDKQRLRSLVLDHLSQHTKLPKARYNEEVLLDFLLKKGVQTETVEALKDWLYEQEKEFHHEMGKNQEGDIETLVLHILRREFV